MLEMQPNKRSKNRKLGNMKSNLKKKNKREQTKSNLPFTGMYLFVELIKKFIF